MIVFGKNLDEMPKVHLCYQLTSSWPVSSFELLDEGKAYRTFLGFFLTQRLPISIMRKRVFYNEIRMIEEDRCPN
jgi:hypothetical protein